MQLLQACKHRLETPFPPCPVPWLLVLPAVSSLTRLVLAAPLEDLTAAAASGQNIAKLVQAVAEQQQRHSVLRLGQLLQAKAHVPSIQKLEAEVQQRCVLTHVLLL